jgi:hypothetical protein
MVRGYCWKAEAYMKSTLTPIALVSGHVWSVCARLKEPTTLMRRTVRLQIVLLLALLSGRAEAAIEFVPDGAINVVFVLDGDIIGDSRKGSNTKVRGAEDCFIRGHHVMAKGAEAQFSVIVTEPRRLLEPGSVRLLLDSVPSVVGKDLPIYGDVEARGEEYYCAMEGCILLVPLMWRKGHPGRLRSGTLVSGQIQISAEEALLVVRPVSAGGSAEPRDLHPRLPLLHFYTQSPSGADIIVDYKRAGYLAPTAYACMSVPSGDHVVSVGKEKLALHVGQQHDYFIRIQARGGDAILDITESYDIRLGQSLAPRRLRKNMATACGY